MQGHVVSWVCTKVSEEPTASVFNMGEQELRKMYSILFVIGRINLQAAGFSEKLVPI